MVEGSFDDAIMGCHGVFHTASPVIKPTSDPKAEILDPAMKGTLNVLQSCKKNPALRRVVLTSSSSTVRVRDDFNPEVPLNESSWSSVELCERLKVIWCWVAQGKAPFSYARLLIYLIFCLNMKMLVKTWYALSKTLAEKAAWEFCNKNGIDLVTVLPSFLIGPSLPPELCATASDVLALLKGA